ncbi:unnamed protein product, partial [Musa hybrid cultivar]
VTILLLLLFLLLLSFLLRSSSIMGTPPHLKTVLFGLCSVFVAVGFASAATQTETLVSVVGATECLDCAQKSIKTENAVKAGLRVAVKCKVSDEQYETKATGELDSNGNFEVKLPSELLLDNGDLKHECFAQLHNTSNAPCPDKNNALNPSKLILKSKDEGKHTFVAASGKLSFSSATCASATFYPCPPLAWKKKHPKLHMPHYKFPPKSHYHPHPVYSPPTYNPPAPVHKAPSGGYYQPPAPMHKPPSGGYYNPPAAPVYKPSPMPHHEHPTIKYHPMPKKTLPHMKHIPHFHHDHPKYNKPSSPPAKVHSKP